ncbi:MAG: hypothetical protein FJ296_07900 [Planctomycetes bacterium]|nr:hypothetical protein [Planctomycetota bacterium]
MAPSRKTSSSLPLVLSALVVFLMGGAAAWLLLDRDELAADPEVPALRAGEAAPLLPEFHADVPDAAARPIDLRPVEVAPVQGEPIVAAVGEPTGCLSGRVVNRQRQPVEGVQLSVYKGNPLLQGISFPGTRRIIEATAASAADGSFQLCQIPVGQAYIVVGEHDDFARSEVPGLRVEKGANTTDVVLVMSEGAVVMGNVNAKGGGPIPGARAELYYQLDNAWLKPEEQRPHKVMFTDGTGRFAFTHVSSSSIRVRVQADGFETQSRTVSQALEAEPRDQHLVFELGQGQSLRGRTVTVRGAPVPKARIEANSLLKDVQATSVAVSDEGGNFILDGLGTQAYQVTATCPGFSDARLPKATVSAGYIQIEMGQRGAAEGHVVTADGKAVPGFTLHLMRHVANRDPNYVGDRRGFQSADGFFRYDNIDPADYVLEARADGWADTRSEPFTIGGGDDLPTRVTIVMLKGGTLCGTVRRADGTPAAGAQVALNENNYVDNAIGAIFRTIAPTDERERKARAGSDGGYCFSGIPPGTYQVAAKLDGSAPEAVNDVLVQDDSLGGNAALDIRLPPGAVIAGRAVTASNRPLAFCKVQISQKDGGGFMEASATDKDGTFAFGNLRPGTYQITVTPSRDEEDKPMHPFLQLVQASKSMQELYVGEGQVLNGVVISLPAAQ